jgi:hypothetical protein
LILADRYDEAKRLAGELKILSQLRRLTDATVHANEGRLDRAAASRAAANALK